MKAAAALLLAAALLAGCATGGGTRPAEGTPAAERLKAAELHTQLGIAYMQEGDLKRALDRLQRAVAADPGYARAHTALGILYERLGEHAKAERHHRRAVRLDPKDSYAHNAYGSFLCARGRFAEADGEFRAAAANPLYETPWVALTNAGLCALRAGGRARGERYLREALERNPRFAPALIAMAELSYDAGRYLQARAYLQRYQAVAAHTPRSLWLGVRVERRLGDRDAEASYALLLKRKFPDAQETRLLLESEAGGGRGP